MEIIHLTFEKVSFLVSFFVIEATKDLIVKRAYDGKKTTVISKIEHEDVITIESLVTSINKEFSESLIKEYTDVLFDVIYLYFKDEEQLEVIKDIKEKNNIIIVLKEDKVEEDLFEDDEFVDKDISEDLDKETPEE